MSEPWSLPGYDVQAMVGFGTTGEVWRAREQATGDLVALKRLTGADPVAAAALRVDLGTPHALRVRDVRDDDGRAVLVLDHADGGSLAALLAWRGRLEPGEVVTVAAPVAQALAAAHARGLVHGDVGAAAVLLTADGMPVLSDLGVAGLVRPDDDPDPAGDVRALAGLCVRLLTGAPAGAPPGPLPGPPALADALEQARRGRVGAAALAPLLLQACPPVPLRFEAAPAAGPALPADRPRRRAAHARRRSRGAAAVAVAAVLACAALGGWAWGRGAAPAASALPPVAAAPADWAAVLAGLDAARARAFAGADPAALQQVWTAGSAGLRADRAALGELAAAGRRARGLRHVLRDVRPVAPQEGDRVRLRVVDVLAPYDVRDAAGALVHRHPGRGPAAWAVELARTPAGWRLVEVRPAG